MFLWLKKTKTQKRKTIIIYLILITLFLMIEQAFLVFYLISNNDKVYETAVFVDTLPEINAKEINNIYTATEKFEFDDLELTFHNSYEFMRIKNEYSNYYNRIVVKVPVTITNKKETEHSLNIYDYTIYGPTKNELDEVAGYFNESIFYAPNLLPNESYKKYLYFLYDSNGNYLIKFNNRKEKAQVILKIERKSNLKTKEEFFKEKNNNIII